jgi:hypothetical protein
MSELLQNAIRIVAEDLYLVSTHQHDYREHTFKGTRHSIAVDGGLAYAKRSCSDFMAVDGWYEEYCLTTDDPFEHIAARLLWGTRGKADDEPLTFRPIKDLSTEHLRAILANARPGPLLYPRVIQYWLDMRVLSS